MAEKTSNRFLVWKEKSPSFAYIYVDSLEKSLPHILMAGGVKMPKWFSIHFQEQKSVIVIRNWGSFHFSAFSLNCGRFIFLLFWLFFVVTALCTLVNTFGKLCGSTGPQYRTGNRKFLPIVWRLAFLTERFVGFWYVYVWSPGI